MATTMMAESRNEAFVNAPEKGPMPHVIVGDEAFPLKTYLDILAARFRVYQRRVQLSPGRLAKGTTTWFSGRTCPTMRRKKELFF